jgi:integrase/recombinase XerD
MLTTFRRHLNHCGHPRQDRSYRRCHCPIHVEGKLGKDFIRKALGTTNWELAQRQVSEAEARGRWDAPEEKRMVTVADAIADFLRDAEHGRRLSPKTLEKYELLLRQLKEFAASKGIRFLKEFDVTLIREFREGWRATRDADLKLEERVGRARPLAARTALKRLESLRAFFRFAVDSQWADKNPAKQIQAPKPRETQKLPFSPAEIERIYAACLQVNLEWGVHNDPLPITNDKLLTFTLLLRHSGLRIGDAVMLTVDRIFDDQKLYLYTQKGTGTHVCVPLPPALIDRLKRLPLRHGRYFFLGPESMNVDAIAEVWRRKLHRAFVKAGVLNGHPHRFRHTFAVELLKAGAKLENVAMLLGHSSIRITERHYAAWVRDRQELLEAEVAKTWGVFGVIDGGRKTGTK